MSPKAAAMQSDICAGVARALHLGATRHRRVRRQFPQRRTRQGSPKPAGKLRLAAFARQGPKDDVPDWRGDAVSVAVVLKVVAHVLLAQPLTELGPGDEVVHVVVR